MNNFVGKEEFLCLLDIVHGSFVKMGPNYVLGNVCKYCECITVCKFEVCVFPVNSVDIIRTKGKWGQKLGNLNYIALFNDSVVSSDILCNLIRFLNFKIKKKRCLHSLCIDETLKKRW